MIARPLTPAERAVMLLLLDSSISSNREIACRLVLSLRTVEDLVQKIYDKLNLHGLDRNRFHACCVYVAHNPCAKERMEQNFVLPFPTCNRDS